MSRQSNFENWLDTLIEEKEIDLGQGFEVEGASGTNYMTYQTVIDEIKTTSAYEQSQIKTMLVKIDFANGDVRHYLRHLAQAIAI